MSSAAWWMLLLAVAVLFGGLSTCIGIALAVDRRKRFDGIGFLDEEDD